MAEDLIDGVVAAWRSKLPGLAKREFELIKRVARLQVLLEEALLREITPYGLSKTEYEILGTLLSVGAPYRLRPTDLTSHLLLTSGGTSKMLKKLAVAGLVEREPDPADARTSWVRLTRHGMDIAREVVEAAAGAQLAVLQPVDRTVVNEAADSLREILLALGDRPARTPKRGR
ncbi:DNA-binding transcriptional regulator, MarR family [Nonomuraea maritima]|uniref:DNA-binding transcriptional regulator, MarR family n=1 Tax=Nonomuraea maritima TaxID=683260 RepID=A0A1G8SKC6_9ACTN|nr:MarR family transcriptional regulator [Nonomuraea maritima]SDJ29624.1 DNA-binding transcriptional regulator, MarR family [Nonomuraea maritima]